MKKTTLSEIYSLMASSRPLEHKKGATAILYLLDLVERMKKLAELVLVEVNPVNVLGPPIVTPEMERKARALLEELKK